MKHIKILIACLCCLLSFAAARAQEPVVSMTDAAGQPEEEVTISVSLEHAAQVSALQIAVPIDEHLSYVEGSTVVNEALVDGHTLSAGMKDGQLQFVLYDIGMHTLKEGQGALFSFKLRLDKHPGVRTLQIANVKAVDAEGVEIEHVTTGTSKVTTLCAQASYESMTIDYGRVPLRSSYTQPLVVTNSGTTDLQITALIFSVNTFKSDVSLPLTVAPGESVNVPIQFAPLKRGKQQAKVRVVSNTTGVRNDITLTADPYAVNELHVGEGLEGESGEEIEVPLRVNNMDALCGFQFEFDLPGEVSYVDGSMKLSDRSQGHQLSTTCTNGHLIVLAYSPTNQCFKGEDGVIATFRVKLKGPYGCTLKATKALLTTLLDDNATNVTSADYGSYVTIRTPSISLDWGNISMGRIPVTQESKATVSIRNYGNATLHIERIQPRDGSPFIITPNESFDIAPWESKNVTITYSTLTKGSFSDVLQIYSNDPSNRLVERTVSGSRYEPNSVSLQAQPSTATDATLTFGLDNYNEVSGIQFDMQVPQGFVFDPAADLQLLGRFSSFSVNCQELPSGLYRVFVYSLSDEVVSRGVGDVLSIQLHPTSNEAYKQQAALQLTQIKVGGPNMADIENYASSLSALLPEPILIGIEGATIRNIEKPQGIVYSIDGVRVGSLPKDQNSLPRGIYICNGKRILIGRE